MIRIPQDTNIHVIVHNLIGRDVSIHGMHTRPGKNDDTFDVTGGATRDVTFLSGAPGAYYYWATAGGDPIGGRPYKEDSQLHGAFIVDAPGTVFPDRVFVIGTWRDRHLPQESFDVPTINGKSWPYTDVCNTRSAAKYAGCGSIRAATCTRCTCMVRTSGS
jgi:hypothetical protein